MKSNVLHGYGAVKIMVCLQRLARFYALRFKFRLEYRNIFPLFMSFPAEIPNFTPAQPATRQMNLSPLTALRSKHLELLGAFQARSCP